MVIEDMDKVFSDTIKGRFVEIYVGEKFDGTYLTKEMQVYVNHEIYSIYCTNILRDYVYKMKQNLNLVPENATILKMSNLNDYKEKLIAGALEDSCEIVYGFCGGAFSGINGYNCNVFWIPTKEELKSFIINY